ncbi:MAG: UDP-N-acetylmuramoyl-L-alanine--D-glutamate ligase [Chloroflexota bacterium]
MTNPNDIRVTTNQTAWAAGLRASIVGLAREGVDLAKYLTAHGADVLVTDAKPASGLTAQIEELAGTPVRYSLGGHPIDEVLAADIVYVSPGVPPTIPLLEEARARRVPISSGIALFFERCSSPIIAITGSSGKTTTTALVGSMLQASGRHTWVGGNIGVPLYSRLPEIAPDHIVVLELSSFQLQPLKVSPWVGAITNITPNHLDRHASMEEYAEAKANIVRFQRPGDWAVLNADDDGSRSVRAPAGLLEFSLERPVEGAFLAGDSLRLRRHGSDVEICRTANVTLRGRHNLANILTACAIVSVAGVENSTMASVATEFRGVAHRLELIRVVNGVSYVNDSIATSPERSMAALASYTEPLVLLAGGKDKHLPMEEWGQQIASRVRELVLFGEAAPLIERAATAAGMPRARIHRVERVPEAVATAQHLSHAGDVVLLSPGGTSYDQYQDYVERGLDFAAAVGSLTTEQSA